MIQKIQSSEYLKRLDNMTAEEKDDYMKRVGEWLEKQAPLLTPKTEEEVARFQNVIQCSAMWNDEECRAWTEGVRLLTAMAPSADTWLPDMLYIKAAKRAINQVMKTLPEQTQQTHPHPLPEMEGSGQTSEVEVSTPLANREGQGESPSGESRDSRKTLRKFLVDTRRGNGATRKEHVKKWKKNFKEYTKLVGEEAYKDEKLLEAAKHYEIDIKKLK